MIVTRSMVVEQARTYLDVPFAHQGRVRAGLDCLGLVIRVAHDLGLTAQDWTGYGRRGGRGQLRDIIEEHCTPVDPWQPGDLLLFRGHTKPQHVGLATPGIATDKGLLHACAGPGRVVEVDLDDYELACLVAAYALPGVSDV